MNLEEAIAQFRVDADDLVEAYLASDVQVTAWLAEAQEEAAIRANLLFESSNTSICDIAVTAGTMGYSLSQSVAFITYADFTPTGSTTTTVLSLKDRLAMDRDYPGWRQLTEEPKYLVVDQTSVQLGCKPVADGTLHIECYRLPITTLADTEEFEIGSQHHRHLIQWALHKHYSRPDAEIHDPQRADKALAEFTRVFGNRPDADMRRGFMANAPAHNQAYW